jgi:hypothetical protein
MKGEQGKSQNAKGKTAFGISHLRFDFCVLTFDLFFPAS